MRSRLGQNVYYSTSISLSPSPNAQMCWLNFQMHFVCKLFLIVATFLPQFKQMGPSAWDRCFDFNLKQAMVMWYRFSKMATHMTITILIKPLYTLYNYYILISHWMTIVIVVFFSLSLPLCLLLFVWRDPFHFCWFFSFLHRINDGIRNTENNYIPFLILKPKNFSLLNEHGPIELCLI